MDYAVDIVTLQPETTAVARASLPGEEISQNIIRLYDQVYAFLKTAPVRQAGLNIAVYFNNAVDFEVGVPVTARFTDAPPVYCSSLPAGKAAHTAHYGPYAKLGEAHAAVVQWCQDQGLSRTGVNLEIYGHWNDDPAQLRTDVYYLLRE